MIINNVPQAFVPAILISRCLLSNPGIICNHCKHQLFDTFLDRFYGLRTDEFHSRFPHCASGNPYNIDPSGDAARTYIRHHLPEWLGCLDHHQGAQLWAALDSTMGHQELPFRDMDFFLRCHYQRILSVVWDPRCTCPDKPVEGESQAMRDGKLIDRIWNYYLDAGIRGIFRFLLDRAPEYEKSEFQRIVEENSFSAMVFLWQLFIGYYNEANQLVN